MFLLFLGHSLIIIKWTWVVFFPKFAIWYPCPTPHSTTIRHKKVFKCFLVLRKNHTWLLNFHNVMKSKPDSYLSSLDGHECCSYLDYKNSKAIIWFSGVNFYIKGFDWIFSMVRKKFRGDIFCNKQRYPNSFRITIQSICLIIPFY